MYVTNQPNIVDHAKHCYKNDPTIVNNISKDKNIYTSSLEDFAKVDNGLAQAQLSIGSSSNLAQISLSYAYTFDDQKYKDAVCILSVLAQASIDSCKRSFACDIPSEIRRLKKEIDLKGNGYPVFWRLIRPEFNRPEMINREIRCPMNYLNSFKDDVIRDTRETLPMDTFFMNYAMKEPKRRSRKIEKLIQDYSLKIYKYNSDDGEDDEYFLLRDDFETLITDIRKTYISNNYLGFMSWLINRALKVSNSVASQSGQIKSVLNKNRALLIKVLYEISPTQFLQCFSKNALKKCTP